MTQARMMDVEGEAEEARQQAEVWGGAHGHLGGGVYEAEQLLERRLHAGQWQYLVRFCGWGPDGDQWESERNVHEAMVAEYDARHPRPADAAGAPNWAGALEKESQPNKPRLGCAAALGESRPRTLVEYELPGADQLSLDGRCRREVHDYKRKEDVDKRTWRVTRVGGYHSHMKGRGEAWLQWARGEYRIGDDGWLLGDLGHADVPRAATFWAACEAKLRAVERTPKADECSFVFERLLYLEATLPVSHFCASDGSRKEPDSEGRAAGEETSVGRVVLSHDGSTLRVLGGGLRHQRRGFERHSYEAELAGFHDHLADTGGSVTVIVTDCLSGSQAGGRFRSRTQADKANRYRAQELDNLELLEERQRAVVYLWVHSHVGITPNEAADAECDAMRDGPIAELDLEPSRFHLVRVGGLKRGVGRATLEFFEARLLLWLMGATDHTLLPNASTWAPFANVRKRRLMRETDVDVLEDGRCNRVGLAADRFVDERTSLQLDGDEEKMERRRAYRPKQGSWEWARQRCACPCCCSQPDAACVHISGVGGSGAQQQTRWHMLTACSPDEAAIGGKRAEAAGWLMRHVADFGTRQAAYALTAITGGADSLDASQAMCALRFLLGLPDAPPDEEEDPPPPALARGYGRYFCSRMADILRAGVKARINMEAGSMLQGRRHELLALSKWKKRRGLREIWSNRETSIRCFRALRVWALRAAARDAVAWDLEGDVRADELYEATAQWRLREAFEELRRRLTSDPRMMPIAGPQGYAFGTFDCTACKPAIALVHLRHAADAPAEVAARKRAAAATRIAAQARAKEARVRARAAKAARNADERRRAETERMRKRGDAVFASIVQNLVRDAERGVNRRATRLVIARIRGRHQAAVREATRRAATGARGRRAFAGLMQQLVRRSEAEANRQATRDVIRRIRERHEGRTASRGTAPGRARRRAEKAAQPLVRWCSLGHALQAIDAASEELTCDSCGRTLKVTVRRFCCVACDFDLCAGCAGALPATAAGEEGRRVRKRKRKESAGVVRAREEIMRRRQEVERVRDKRAREERASAREAERAQAEGRGSDPPRILRSSEVRST